MSAASHPLPSGEFSIETHLDVLRRFMAASRNGIDPVEPSAAEGTGLPPGAARLNAPFLGDIGLLVEEKPGWFKVTPVAMQLINTLLGDEGRGRRLLRSIIEKAWFGKAAKTFMASGKASPFEEEDLAAFLGTAALVPEGADPSGLRLLVEYLVYTGILVRPPAAPSTSNVRPPGPFSVRSQAPRNASATPPRPAVPNESRSAESPSEEQGREWELIQTNEFTLKIRPDSAAVKRLRKQLDLLEESLGERQKPKRRG